MFWGVFYRKTGLLEKFVIARGTSKQSLNLKLNRPLHLPLPPPARSRVFSFSKKRSFFRESIRKFYRQLSLILL